MKDDEREFRDHPDQPGAPLVLQVQPEKRITACGTCRHVRPEYGSLSRDACYQKCAAVGSYCASLRYVDSKTKAVVPCNMWEPKPETKRAAPLVSRERVGFLRWLWRLLW